ncbi:MAG: PqqD family protein [FCB group bacterium]|nr:PqqD family protein [FCB group bacterium]
MIKANYKISDSVIWEKVADEMIVFKLSGGQYYRFNNTGLIVWEGLVDQLPDEAMVKRIESEFGGKPENIRRDVTTFINELLSEDLIRSNA